MTNKLNENSLVEQPVIAWLKELGYDYEPGPDLSPGQVTSERENFREVLLLPRLKRSLIRINPWIDEMEDEAIEQLMRIEHLSLEEENLQVFKLLTEGVKIQLWDKNGEEQYLVARFFDFENPLNNEFLVGFLTLTDNFAGYTFDDDSDISALNILAADIF